MNDHHRQKATSEPDATKAAELESGLYLVGTPIGNLSDTTERALATLAAADVVVCEDTRVTRKLLSAFGLSPNLLTYHEHNAAKAGPQIVKRVAAGEVVALVSDAGLPLISDPGFKLVQSIIEADLQLVVIPGANAALAALIGSGLPTDRFLFAGFAPAKSAARRTFLTDLADIDATLILYESPRRLAGCLADIVAVLGDRRVAVARELTKRYEEFRRGRASQLIDDYGDLVPKGEITLVIGPPDADVHSGVQDAAAAAVRDLLRLALPTLSVRDAVDLVASATGRSKKPIYDMALDLKRQLDGDNSEPPGETGA